MKGHFPASVFDDMWTSVKQGSLIIFSMRDAYWDNGNSMGYKIKVDSLVEEKKYEFVKRHIFTKFEGLKGE